MQNILPSQIGQTWLVLDALRVQDIVGARPWVPIPHASPDVPGVVQWRGRAIAVFDLSRLAGTGEPLRPGVHRPRTLIVEARACFLAMPVDVVHEVQAVPPNLLRTPHATRMRFTAAEVEVFGSPVPLLDLDALVDSLLALGGPADGS